MSERFANELRAAIEDSGISRYRICKKIGLSESVMSRFMNHKESAGLSMDMINKLADLLGLHVTVIRPKRRPSQKGR
ncbi:MAG: helix-turn-helix transcriptional regulator [Phycisphaerae bacterium]|nr:helix-turn-helix transcriptional regulator [Phycisphaerae bacterium]